MINVNDVVISEKEYDFACQEYMMRAKKQNMSRDEYMAIANQLIDAHLFLEDAEKSGVQADAGEIDESFSKIKANYKSDEEFEKVLKTMGDTQESFKEKVTKDMVLRKYLNDSFYSQINISEEMVKTFYQENEASFITGDQVRASHILVDNAGEAELLHAKLKNGEDFNGLAKEKSKCPSGKEGGDLGYFPKGKMVKEFEETAFDLDVGEISGIVQTQFGFHIIKLTDKKTSEKVNLDKASEVIKNELAQKAVTENMQKRIVELRKGASIELNQEVIDAKVGA